MTNRIYYNFLLVTLLSFLLCFDVYGARKIEERDYFSSIRASKANIRSGPGKHYPIKFTFHARGIPVHVISEYDNWNEIKDYQGHTGWVSKALLTKRRTLMVFTSSDKIVNMHNKRDEKSRVLYHLKNFVIGDYIECKEGWCKMKVNGKKGWVRQQNLFGNN